MMSLFREWLEDAKLHGYAIPAVDVHNAETVDATVAAAKELKSPIILALAHSHAGYTYNYTHASTIAVLVHDALRRYDVKACLHIDHGRHFEFIKEAISLGFNSVMIDASEKPFDENVQTVSEVVEYAHKHGIGVEAELGHVGKGEEFDTQEAIESSFTRPEEAQEFVRRTNVDALAVAFGTKHGVYKSTPHLDIPRLMKIRELTNIPLVMHGTSGVSEEDIKRSIQAGICKVNVFTEIADAAKRAFIKACENPKTRFPDALVQARLAFKERVQYYIQVCGSAGRAE
jgi:ketose-bisphosphate aldolase